jgi:leucyl-tRNA synthetase
MFNHKDVEEKWQKFWQESNAFKTEESTKENYYTLDMFTYPSGEGLHMGHVRIYTASDIIARYYRMRGKNVLHPTGWDAFGLPAENFAIKHKTHPSITTKTNIANIKRQFKELGMSYDWDKEINTTDPGYYKWTQWIFLKLLEHGLAYEAEVPINWCPSCKTGLANEEVIAGKCERCGTETIRKNMKQWMLKITEYADRLLLDLDDLDWPEKIKLMQKNWIGKKHGINITYQIDGSDKSVTCFTTRPDTNFGATFVVIGPEHELLKDQSALSIDSSTWSEIRNYLDKSAVMSEIDRLEVGREKTGVFTGLYCVNSLNNYKMPLYVADYVLGHVGTGAVVGVPAHDKRDFEFANKFNIPVIRVVEKDGEKGPITSIEQVQEESGKMINSDFLDGLDIHDATQKIMDHLEENGWGKRVVNYKLRDWVFSRQRYWGEPIPVIHCPNCGVVPVPEKDLPVLLPDLDKYEPTGTGESPLATVESWVNVKCPLCGANAKRETNTMPQWAGSCWYYLRYLDPNNADRFARADLLKEWLPVDIYMGGAEHAVLHLLYARFWHKFLFDLKFLPTPEPFQRLESVGIVLAKSYKNKQGKYVHISDVVVDGDTAFQKSTGELLTSETEKMSKSKGNVVSPDDLLAKYGADVVRTYMMFLGPWGDMCSFDISGLEGSSRFLKRVNDVVARFISRSKNSEQSSQKKIIAQSIIKITADIENFRFNTAVSQLMIMLNSLDKDEDVAKQDLEIFLQLLSPIAPHIAEELWSMLGNTESIFKSAWPIANADDAKEDEIEIAVQINGKMRGIVKCSPGTSKDAVLESLKKDSKIMGYVNGKIAKEIFVQDKILNLVIKQ